MKHKNIRMPAKYLAILSSVFFVFDLNITRLLQKGMLNHRELISVCVNISLTLALVLIRLNCAFRNTFVVNPKNYSFETMMTLECLAMMCGTLLCYTNGSAKFRLLSFLVVTIYRYTGVLVTAIFMIYINSFEKKPSTTTKKISISLCIFAALFLILNIHFKFCFTYNENGVFETRERFPVWWFILLVVIICDFIEIARLKIKPSYKFFLYFCILLPFSGLILRETVLSIEILHPSITVSLILIFSGIFANREKEIERRNKRLSERATQIMLSQIKPHFLFNSLSSIGVLCEKNPSLAKESIDVFSNYLRWNMNSLSKTEPVPFEEELNHIKTYLWLRQLRYTDKLSVDFQIETVDFCVPVLSIRTLVENAVRHGIFESDGGTVSIITKKLENSIRIIIKDNGIGFDVNSFFEKSKDNREHIGITSSKERIENMVSGSFLIKSKINFGTEVIIEIPFDSKEAKQ